MSEQPCYVCDLHKPKEEITYIPNKDFFSGSKPICKACLKKNQ